MFGVDDRARRRRRSSPRSSARPRWRRPAGRDVVRSAIRPLAYSYICDRSCNTMTGRSGRSDRSTSSSPTRSSTRSRPSRSRIVPGPRRSARWPPSNDGSISLGFGLGKYPNRGVMDAYAGVSRGTEQWTVRASRELGADGDTAAVGPMRYEVLEPMRRIRFALDRERRAARLVRMGLRGRRPVGAREPRGASRCATDAASTPTSRATTTSAPPTVGSTSTVTASSSTTRRGSPPATIRGASATRSASRSRMLRPRRFRRTSRRRSSGRRSS